MKIAARPGDSVSSGHLSLSSLSAFQLRSAYRDSLLDVSGRTQFALPKPGGMQQVPPRPGVQTGRYQDEFYGAFEAFDDEQGNSAQRIRDELCHAPIAGAVDPSARPDGGV